MAICESIKRAMEALEEECTTASVMAQCLSETHAETDTDEAAWVSVHQNAVRRLTEAADALVQAINWSQP